MSPGTHVFLYASDSNTAQHSTACNWQAFHLASSPWLAQQSWGTQSDYRMDYVKTGLSWESCALNTSSLSTPLLLSIILFFRIDQLVLSALGIDKESGGWCIPFALSELNNLCRPSHFPISERPKPTVSRRPVTVLFIHSAKLRMVCNNTLARVERNTFPIH